MKAPSSKIYLLGVLSWWIAALFFLYEFFLRTFISALAPQLRADLHLSIEAFTALGSAYYVAYGLMQVPVGILVDRFGVKKVLIFATLTCVVATLSFSHSQGLVSAFLSRFFMGFGSSFAFVCLLSLASAWFPREYFGLLSGASQFVGTLGPVLAGGPLVSVLLGMHESWRTLLNIVAYLGVVLALLTFLIVKNKPSTTRRSLLFLSQPRPLKERLKILFKNRALWRIVLYSSASYVPLAVLSAVLGLQYLQGLGFSQSSGAYMISLSWIAYALACPCLGFLSDKQKRRKPFLQITALLGLFCTLGLLWIPAKSQWMFDALFFLLGIAASGQNLGFVIIVEAVAPEIKASALGLNNGMISLFSAVCPFVVGVLVTISTSMFFRAHGGASGHSMTAGLLLLPLLYLVASVLSFWGISETYAKPQRSFLVLYPKR